MGCKIGILGREVVLFESSASENFSHFFENRTLQKKIANNFPTKKWKIANTYLLSETNQHLIVIPFSLRLVSHLFLCVFCVCRERGSEGEDGGSEE